MKVTLWKFWDVTDDATQDAVPVDGVSACVIKARPYSGAWSDFRDVHDTCAKPSPDGTKLVIENVPPLSELLLTVEKDGYRGSVYPLTTGQWDLDMTAYSLDLQRTQLRRADSWARPGLPVSADPELGDLSGVVSFVFGGAGRDLAGATVALHPRANDSGIVGEGPFYWNAGRVDSEAKATIYGAATSQRTRAGVLFVNVPEGEYQVTVSDSDVTCTLAGIGGGSSGETDFGYPSRKLNEVRAPVLARHSTPFFWLGCQCSSQIATQGAYDAAACPTPPDGATP